MDGQGTDVSSCFSYLQGSTTEGHLSYVIENLAYGSHSLVLRSFDGVGNLSLDTLVIITQAATRLVIQEAIVYPSPGSGQRCFSFRVSSDANVTVGIYTVSGRLIQRLSASCDQGYNQILWDGRDSDGDILATGSYVYHINAVSRGSTAFEYEADFTGIFAEIK